MALIRVIAQNSGAGLRKDIQIISEILTKEGHEVEELILPLMSGQRSRWIGQYRRGKTKILPSRAAAVMTDIELKLTDCRKKRKVDINIFLEILFPEFIRSARRNVLIPNQEWFKPELLSYLPWIDLVLCKTREADRVFSELKCVTKFISFTSVDSFRAEFTKDCSRALHFAGNGLTKGTKALIDVWLRHPEWPELWVSQKDHLVKQGDAQNIRYFDRFLSESELPRLQSEAAFYIGPSEAEGFGHALVEAMSAKTLVVTTDGSPMNEVVTRDRGFLAAPKSTSPKRLGTSYHVDEEALERTVTEALSLSGAERMMLGDNARQWYLENDKFFCATFIETIDALR